MMSGIIGAALLRVVGGVGVEGVGRSSVGSLLSHETLNVFPVVMGIGGVWALAGVGASAVAGIVGPSYW